MERKRVRQRVTVVRQAVNDLDARHNHHGLDRREASSHVPRELFDYSRFARQHQVALSDVRQGLMQNRHHQLSLRRTNMLHRYSVCGALQLLFPVIVTSNKLYNNG